MKTSLLSLLAVATAIVLIPVSVEVAGSLLFATGIVAMFLIDYRLATRSAATDLVLARQRAERLRLAA